MKGYELVVCFVSRLLFGGGPPAVTWFVVSGVVGESVYGQSRRALSHVFQKFCKFKPSLAHIYSLCSVAFKAAGRLGSASCEHISPNHIRSGFRACWRVSVDEFGDYTRLVPEASTGTSGAIFKAFITNSCSFPTGTFANTDTPPLSSTKNGWAILCDFQPSKCPTDNRYSRRHNDGDNIVVFSSGYPASTGTRYEYGLNLT